SYICGQTIYGDKKVTVSALIDPKLGDNQIPLVGLLGSCLEGKTCHSNILLASIENMCFMSGYNHYVFDGAQPLQHAHQVSLRIELSLFLDMTCSEIPATTLGLDHVVVKHYLLHKLFCCFFGFAGGYETLSA
ncbi:hypothetical protein ACJX0J_031311, partial [Zea mays]